MSDKVYTYKGRLIAELSREELLIAVQWAFDTIEADREFHRVNAAMEREFARAEQVIRHSPGRFIVWP